MRHRVQYIGNVQGVGFRATACALAGKFPVTGWVLNEPDQSVLLEVQGGAADVAAYLAEIDRVMARNIREKKVETVADLVKGVEGGFVVKE